MIIDTNGYSNKFDVYQGKFEQVPEKMKCFGLGKRVVLSWPSVMVMVWPSA